MLLLNRIELALVQGKQIFSALGKSRAFLLKTGCGTVTAGSVLAYQAAARCDGDSNASPKRTFHSMWSKSMKASNGVGGGPGSDGKSDPVSAFISQYSGFLQNLGFSGVLGACSGVALKRASREAAATIGIAFIGLQALAYLGYIKIDYTKVQSDAAKVVDVNGDGKLDEKDLQAIWAKVKDVLSFHLPQAGSFSTGFALGFYYF